jgi:hypothetical protein
MARHHRMVDGTRGRINAIPAGTGHGGDYRPLCSDAVSMISAHTALCPVIPASKTTSRGQLGPGHHRLQDSAPDQPPSRGLGTVHQGLGHLGVRARRDPPLRCSLGTDQASPRARSVYSGTHVHHCTHSEAVLGLPRRTRSDGTGTPPQCSMDGPLRQPRRHRNRPQVSDTPPLLAQRRIVSTCTVLVFPSTIKGEDLGHLGGTNRGEHLVTHTRIHIPAA